MFRWVNSLISALLPAVLASLAVFFLDTRVAKWVSGREAFLPLLLCLLLSTLLHPRLRQALVVTLCYGVAFLAVKDISAPTYLRPPAWLDYDWFDAARALALAAVALLAVVAAIGETRQPGTVWARRCYFLAAAGYFFGIGLIYVLNSPSWRAVALCITGVIALIGSLFAERIIASEQEEMATTDEDAAEQQERDQAHLRVLRAKEWQDHGDKASAVH